VNASDPRRLRSQEAILAAARSLLRAEGPAAVTHQRVAARARVGRATVYRHWPRPEELLLAVISGTDMPFFADATRPVRPWLAGQLRRLADELALPEVAATALTLMQGAWFDAESAERRDASVGTMTTRIGAALTLAADAGELRTCLDPADATALLIGPLFYRTTVQAGAVPDELIQRLLDALGTWLPWGRPPSV